MGAVFCLYAEYYGLINTLWKQSVLPELSVATYRAFTPILNAIISMALF